MNNNHKPRFSSVLMRPFWCLLLLYPASQATQANEISVNYNFSHMQFSTQGHDGATLQIQGQGVNVSRHFEANAAIDFNMNDDAGNTLPDGEYSYSLDMKSAEMEADAKALKKLAVSGTRKDDELVNEIQNRLQNSTAPKGKSGRFIVYGGQVTDAEAIENQEQSDAENTHSREASANNTH